MTLNQPSDEQCSNCYFCTSYMKEEKKYNGFLSAPNTIIVEIFLCNRYPPIHNVDCKISGTSHVEYRLVSAESIASTAVNPKSWCGEWKPRKETNKI